MLHYNQHRVVHIIGSNQPYRQQYRAISIHRVAQDIFHDLVFIY